jgi:glucokinase
MTPTDDLKILGADIGGTKTDLGLYSFSDGKLRELYTKRFLNSGYDSAMDIISDFLRESYNECGGTECDGTEQAEGSEQALAIESAVIAVAAFVEDGAAELTNLKWSLKAKDISERFKIPEVRLVNDLVATGWGIGLLTNDDLHSVQGGVARMANVAVIAPGTGLGESILFWDGAKHVSIPSEGGHVDFAPRDAREFRLMEFVAKRLASDEAPHGRTPDEVLPHVSVERVLSGPGIKNIFDFLCGDEAGRNNDNPSKDLLERIGPRRACSSAALIPPSALITTEALRKDGDELCKETLKFFLSLLGAEAGNLALKAMSTGGVYIAGGIAPQILDAFKWGSFINAFREKGRFKGLLSEVPVYIILNPSVALLGSVRCAAELAKVGQASSSEGSKG